MININILKLAELGIPTPSYVVYDSIEDVDGINSNDISVDVYRDPKCLQLIHEAKTTKDKLVSLVDELHKTYGNTITLIIKELPEEISTVILLEGEVLNYDGKLTDSQNKTLNEIIDVINNNFNLFDSPYELAYAVQGQDVIITGLEHR